MTDETCCGACGFPVHATKEMACDWCRKSADRIEALTAKLATCEKYRDAYDEMGRIGTQAVRDLEAKLAKAEEGQKVKALEQILEERGAVFDAMVDAAEDAAGKGVSFNVVVGRALRAALAEIKGESHD